MIISRNRAGSVVAFQKLNVAGKGIKKCGFICEADTVGDALNGVVQLVAKHCTSTGQHPAHIIEGIELK